jgi:PqqD family protein of HPr-rel-A system
MAPSAPAAAPVAVVAAGVWRTNPLIELHWRDWGEDSVVFEARSGQLFQFDPLAAALMACFEVGPRALGGVVAELSHDLGVDPEHEVGDTVLALVEEFRRLGWLEPIIGA